MNEDDPVEELHKIRQAIWKKAGGTPEAYAQYYYEIGQRRLAVSKATCKDKALSAKAINKTGSRKLGRQRKKIAVQ